MEINLLTPRQLHIAVIDTENTLEELLQEVIVLRHLSDNRTKEERLKKVQLQLFELARKMPFPYRTN